VKGLAEPGFPCVSLGCIAGAQTQVLQLVCTFIIPMALPACPGPRLSPVPLTGADPDTHPWANIPSQPRPFPREVPDAQGWGCPGAPGCPAPGWGRMGQAARACPTAPQGAPSVPGALTRLDCSNNKARVCKCQLNTQPGCARSANPYTASAVGAAGSASTHNVKLTDLQVG